MIYEEFLESLKDVIEAGTDKRPLIHELECKLHTNDHSDCTGCVSKFQCHQLITILAFVANYQPGESEFINFIAKVIHAKDEIELEQINSNS